MAEQINNNFVEYIREAQQGRLFNGSYIICNEGKIVAAGSEASMNAVYKDMKSPNKDLFKVDLVFAKSQKLEDLEKIVQLNKL